MANENNITNNLIKIEPEPHKRSTSLDQQLWSHAWEEAYLSLQTNNDAGAANSRENSQSDNATAHNENNLKVSPASTNGAVSASQQVYVDVGSPKVATSIETTNLSTPNNSLTPIKTFVSSYGLANSSVNVKEIPAKATSQINQSANTSNFTKSEVTKYGFHVYVTESGEIKVWMRNQSLKESAGLALIQKLRSAFGQLGYTLAYFSLNGESIFVNSQSNEAKENGESDQSLIDKSY